MFNGRLKQQLEQQNGELALLRQLGDQLERQMLSLRLDADARICACNNRFAETLGYREAQLIGRPLAEIVPPYVKHLPCFHNFQAAIARFEPVSDDYRYLQADGSLAWLRVHRLLDGQERLGTFARRLALVQLRRRQWQVGVDVPVL